MLFFSLPFHRWVKGPGDGGDRPRTLGSGSVIGKNLSKNEKQPYGGAACSNSQFETWEFLPGYDISGRCLRSFLLKTDE